MTVKTHWRVFAANVLAPDAPEVQRTEMRRAFYGGFWAMLQEALAIGAPDVPEAEGIARIEAWRRECERFKDDVLEGKA